MTAKAPSPKRAHEEGLFSEPLVLFARRRLFWLVASVIVVSGAALALILTNLRGIAIVSGERLTESFAHIIAEQSNSTLQTIDQRLQFAASRITQMRATGGFDEATGEILREEIKPLPFVLALSVADKEGRIIDSSHPINVGQSLADRGYFQTHKSEPQSGFLVGPPVRSRTTGSWLLTASRPLLSEKGLFDGIIVAALEPGYLDDLWRKVDLGEGSSIALFRRDGVLMMRSPLTDAVMGKSFHDNPLFTTRIPASLEGLFQDESPIDGVARMLAYRTLSGNRDLVVVVGRLNQIVLAPWRQLATLALSTWALASLVTGILGMSLNNSWRQRIQTEMKVEQIAQRLTLATDAASIGVWDWDLAGDRWSATPTYYTMLGYGPDQIAGHGQWLERVHPEDREAVAANIEGALKGADVPYRHDARILHGDGSYRWVSVIGRVLARDEHGKPTRLLGVMMDITENKQADDVLRKSMQEKEALLKEVHHRVKNNLQVITSLLRLEASRSGEPATRNVLKDMQGRIRSMALLHETLYNTGKFARVDLSNYLQKLATQLFRAHNTDPGEIRLVLNLEPVNLEIDQAIPCGLIVNELLTNSLKHAFAEGLSGEVRVELGREPDGSARLRVSDTGVGLASDFDSSKTNSLGLQLVSDLARQLGGRLEIGSGPGAVFSVIFPAGANETGLISRVS